MIKSKMTELEIVQAFRCLEEAPEKYSYLYGYLIKKFSFVPASLAAKYRKFDNYQDILQVGYETLFKAILTFEYQKSPNFLGWVWWWVRKEIGKEALREKRYLEKNVRVGEFSFLDKTSAYNPECVFLAREDELVMQDILNKLDKDSKLIIEKTFGTQGKPLSLRKLAEELEVSHETIRQKRLRAVRKLAILYSRY